MNHDGLNKTLEAIKKAKTVAIMGHKEGDGDFYGSAFALSMGLRKLDKKAFVLNNEELPEALDFLYFFFNGEIKKSLTERVDLLVILDTSDKRRTMIPCLVDSKEIQESVLIDHHTKGDLIEIVGLGWVDVKYCSVSEMIFHLLKGLDVEIDKNMATCLLTGIETDTASFQNQNTTKECFFVASELMARGARLKAIINNTFGGKPVDILKIWGLAINRIKLKKEFGAIISYLTYDEIQKYGISVQALSGIANFLNSIKGAKVLIFLTEEEKGVIKASLRTRDEKVDVSLLARLLGGGGHAKASGFTIKGHIRDLGESAVFID